MMLRSLWTSLVLISLVCALTVSSKKSGSGKSKTGGWNSGSNRNPNYPGGYGWNTGGNTGGSWGQPYNPSGGNNFNNKQWKPPKSKTNMKAVAVGAAAGAIGGYMLGNAMGRMSYHFSNPMEARYYNDYYNQMPERVYRPMYRGEEHVSEDRFVTDCYNMSVTEYIIKPAEGKNTSEVNQLETRVKSQIIREMCITEYRRGSGFKVLSNPWLILTITLFVYFVIE
ncbi:prion protein isoform X2 [Xenopus tropicalis]|eukprot:XP_012821571.1 PREDICTED: prion protein isoform X2 [Xenopus tropicalis]